MSIDDLRRHMLGERWITSQEPVDLDSGRPAGAAIPTVAQRRRAIGEIALSALGPVGSVDSVSRVQILEGFFFPGQNRYLALVADLSTKNVLVVGSAVPSYKVEPSDLAPWRQLYIATGELLENGAFAAWQIAE